ncbi:PP2C family protein-serine/threonine phosphatase [Paenibacillus rigui]|nr:GAF domain-containing SpoIIE family protein phosphatase [Paenibacillus rigui]
MELLPGTGYGIVGLLLVLALAAGWWHSHQKRREADYELSRTLQLFEVSVEMNSTIHKQDLLHKIMETSARVMNAEASSVILVDTERSELYFEVAIGDKGDEVQEIRLKLGEGIAGWVAETGKSVKIDDASQDPRWSSKVAKTVDYTTRNLLCVPIFSKGAVIGVLQVLNKRDGARFTDKDLRLLESIASPTAVSLENAMLYEALQRSIQALKTTVEAKERMESELRIAQQIQLGLLPSGSPVRNFETEVVMDDAGIGTSATSALPSEQTGGEKRLVDVHSIIRPAREVGGDFFDYFWVSDKELFFTLGDVSDKGIPAALFMTVTMTLIRGKMKAGMTPGELLDEVNRELYKDDSTMFATIFCGVLNVVTGELQFSDGGHCTPYCVRTAGELEPVRGAKGLPLGVMDEMAYTDNLLQLHPGDLLVLYTDGITEAEDPGSSQYGSSRLQQQLSTWADSPEGERLRQLVTDVDRFAAGAPQSDDIAVLSIGIRLDLLPKTDQDNDIIE